MKCLIPGALSIPVHRQCLKVDGHEMDDYLPLGDHGIWGNNFCLDLIVLEGVGSRSDEKRQIGCQRCYDGNI